MPVKKKAKKAKSKVNEAGNYTKPDMRKRQFNRIKHTKMLVEDTSNEKNYGYEKSATYGRR